VTNGAGRCARRTEREEKRRERGGPAGRRQDGRKDKRVCLFFLLSRRGKAGKGEAAKEKINVKRKGREAQKQNETGFFSLMVRMTSKILRPYSKNIDPMILFIYLFFQTFYFYFYFLPFSSSAILNEN